MSEERPPIRGRPPKKHSDQAPAWSHRLRLARVEAGWTIEQLATRAGLQAAAVSRYDAGERTPNVVAGLALAEALGLTVEYLFKGIGKDS